MNNKEFNYTYSAPTESERKEIESIRRQYVAPEKVQTKMDRLRYLNAKVYNSATCVALIIGIVGCLIFGLGMAMVLEWNLLFWGIAVSVLGGIPMIGAYPLYQWILNRNKRKYGEEILQLCDEVIQ